MDNGSEKKHAGRPCGGVRFAFDTAPSLVAKLPLPRPQEGAEAATFFAQPNDDCTFGCALNPGSRTVPTCRSFAAFQAVLREPLGQPVSELRGSSLNTRRADRIAARMFRRRASQLMRHVSVDMPEQRGPELHRIAREFRSTW
jgi:hypothetical protein